MAIFKIPQSNTDFDSVFVSASCHCLRIYLPQWLGSPNLDAVSLYQRTPANAHITQNYVLDLSQNLLPAHTHLASQYFIHEWNLAMSLVSGEFPRFWESNYLAYESIYGNIVYVEPWHTEDNYFLRNMSIQVTGASCECVNDPHSLWLIARHFPLLSFTPQLRITDRERHRFKYCPHLLFC